MNFEKLIVAPQITIYKNIFKYNKELINILSKNNEKTILGPWKEWYTNGYRKGIEFYLNSTINEDDIQDIKKEKEYLKNLCDILNFIKKDYFNDFENKKGIWPSFIKNWSKVKAIPDNYYIDFFKYDINKIIMPKYKDMYMQYHVDEFPILNDINMLKNIVTINFYLNDDYDGGEICMYDSTSNTSYKYKPRPGDAVVMPSSSPFYHGVKNFYNSDRYFVRGFFTYETEEGIFSYDKQEKEKDMYVKNHLQTIKVNVKEIEIL